MTSKNMFPRICRSCGETFPGGPRAWYCPTCRNQRKKDQTNKYHRLGPARPLGSSDRCIACGEIYIVAGGSQKYCEKCSKKEVAKLDCVQGLSYYHATKTKRNPVRNVARHTPPKICPVCGKAFKKHTTQKLCDACRAKK